MMIRKIIIKDLTDLYVYTKHTKHDYELKYDTDYGEWYIEEYVKEV